MPRLWLAVLTVGLVLVNVVSGGRVRRVIGGQTYEAGKWPWLVSIKGKVPDSMFFGIPLSYKNIYCGGSLLNDRWVVTAAHCFSEHGLGELGFQPRYWHVRLGELELTPSLSDQVVGWIGSWLDWDSMRSWYLHASRIVIHPDYNRDEMWHNDIALIQLEESVPTSAAVVPEIQAAVLPPANTTDFPTDHQACIMKGWGCTASGGSVNNVALEVTLPKVSDAECGSFWSVETRTRLCAGHNLNDMGICSGDSGGPLVCEDAEGRYVQVGIASFTSAARPGNVPGAFTRVSAYIDWITDIIGTPDVTPEETVVREPRE